MRRLLVGLAALAAAGLTSGGLLLATDAGRGTQAAYTLTRDVPAGAPIALDALRVERVQLAGAAPAALGPSLRTAPARLVASHELHAGQLLQRGDVDTGRAGGERRAVFVPLRDVPGAVPGGRVDLFSVTGPGDRPVVTPVALDVEVRAGTASGLVLVVGARQAPALVFAGAALHLVAVAAEPGSGRAEEAAVSSLDQALEALRR